MSWTKLQALAGILLGLAVGSSALLSAQTQDQALGDPLRHPGWNYGVQLSGGTTLVQVSSPSFLTANRNITNFAASFHLGRVLSHEHGRGWLRGTFEWDFNVIPVEIFWVLGYHYAGGFEALGPRWNFTHNRRCVVPFAGLAGGLLFSPENFPPGPTYQTNFTIGVDAGVHLFVRRKRSIDVFGRVYHLSNAFQGRSNPGIPVGLQLTLGYVWY
jgi:Lipid A 3-O-deacylase (PagL)